MYEVPSQRDVKKVVITEEIVRARTAPISVSADAAPRGLILPKHRGINSRQTGAGPLFVRSTNALECR